nr:MAG TPA: hypothetical protein [Caudoviricetes sp.]
MAPLTKRQKSVTFEMRNKATKKGGKITCEDSNI